MAVTTNLATLPKPANEYWERRDALGVCNLLLDELEHARPVTVLILHKLVYFAHGLHLVRTGHPLVSGYFFAWQFGPALPTIEAGFEAAGTAPIAFRAVTSDLDGKWSKRIEPPQQAETTTCIREAALTYGRLSVENLVDLTRAPNTPWDFVVNKARTTIGSTLRISDALILERFKHHKLSVTASRSTGVPNVDAPLTAFPPR